jgi:hypothetical protein
MLLRCPRRKQTPDGFREEFSFRAVIAPLFASPLAKPWRDFLALVRSEMKIARSIKSPQGIAFSLFHTNHQVQTRTLKTEGCGTHVTSVINKDK